MEHRWNTRLLNAPNLELFALQPSLANVLLIDSFWPYCTSLVMKGSPVRFRASALRIRLVPRADGSHLEA